MPLDTKRINGPEISTSYWIHCKANTPKTFEERLSDSIGKDGKRKDGRLLHESRKYYAKVGVVSTAKGSAYIELGNTKVIVSVFDPREIPKQNKFSQLGELFCDFKFSPFASLVRKTPQTDARDRSMAMALASALNPSVCRHLFPNLQIDVFVNVLEDDGSALSVAITAAGLALGDACIPMFDIVTAATAGILGNRIIVDPTAEEEALCMDGYTEDNHGLVMLAKLSTLDQVPDILQYGNVNVEKLWETCKQLNTNCADLVPIVQQLLVSKVKTRLRELEVESDEESEPSKNKEGNNSSGEDK
ncbi:exosome complex component MTR3-like [Anopheles maculipalpis]|uniref:exosome complex component MTR3-like n=1 Tax=Anopheles maculipalpis TaxID=1496333 RepID=UPI0021595B1D|nr:exosome complex component MTR3-like [Anopheles maculipalpis]